MYIILYVCSTPTTHMYVMYVRTYVYVLYKNLSENGACMHAYMHACVFHIVHLHAGTHTCACMYAGIYVHVYVRGFDLVNLNGAAQLLT